MSKVASQQRLLIELDRMRRPDLRIWSDQLLHTLNNSGYELYANRRFEPPNKDGHDLTGVVSALAAFARQSNSGVIALHVSTHYIDVSYSKAVGGLELLEAIKQLPALYGCWA